MNTQRAFVHQLNGLALVAGLLLAGACAGPVTESGAPEESRPTPNIVFILVDDLRWDDIGAAGHPFVETPNIDRLAAEGAMFSNAFATTPLCSPSRASLSYRSLCACERHHRQCRAGSRESCAVDVSPGAPGRRLRDGVHRQVAYGP